MQQWKCDAMSLPMTVTSLTWVVALVASLAEGMVLRSPSMQDVLLATKAMEPRSQRGQKAHVAAMRKHSICKSMRHLGAADLNVVFDPSGSLTP